MNIATLGVVIRTQGVREADRELGSLTRTGEQAERRANSLGKAWGTALGGAVVAGLGGLAVAARKYAQNTIEAEKVQAQLEARLKSTGGAAGLAMRDLNRLADGLQRVTTFDDEAIGGVQSLLLTFTRIGKDAFPRATEAVLDMSTALGTDLKSAALQVGKALNDPVQGVTALSRAGVQFTDAQKETIKQLTETGRVAEAQTIVLRELETQMGGSARAARDTLGGALAGLSNTFDNLLEGDTEGGGLNGMVGAVNSLNDTLNDPQIKAGIDTIASGVASLTSQMIEGASVIANYLSEVKRIYQFNTGALGVGNASYDQLTRRYGDLAETRKRLQQGGSFGAIKDLYSNNGTLGLSDLGKTPAEALAAVEKEMQDILRRQAQLNRQDIANGIVWNPNANQIPTMRGNNATTLETALKKATRSPRDSAIDSFPGVQAFENAMLSAAGANAFMSGGSFSQFLPEADKQFTLFADGMEEKLAGISEGFAGMASSGEHAMGDLTVFAEQAGRNMQDAFADTLFDVFSGETEDMEKRWSDMLLRMAAELASSQLLNIVGNWGKQNAGGDGWVGTLASAIGSMFGGKATPNAKGNVYQSPSLHSYVNGVYNSPRMFAFANGGVFAEAGPEAIMPLTRTAGGKLGVQAVGAAPVVNVTIEKGAREDRVDTSQGSNGGIDIRIMVKNMVQGMVAGGDLDRVAGQAWGVRRTGMSRG